MARKTPDYTRQARKREPAPRAAARPAGGARKGSGAGRPVRQTAAVEVAAAAPAPRRLVLLAYAGGALAVGLFIYGAVVSSRDLGLVGVPGRDAIVAFSGMLAGLVTAALLLLLVNAVLDPGRRVLPGVDVRRLLYAAVFFGMFAGLLALSARAHIAVLGAGYTLVLLVFSLAVRPRLRGAESQVSAHTSRR